MITEFKGRTAVITGAGSGFGLEVARLAASRGMQLVLLDVQKDALDAAQAELEATGAQVLAQRVDVSSAEHMAALAEAVQARFGAPLRGQWKAHGNSRQRQRVLKVGYVSPDFRDHASVRFLEPLLSHHDKGAVRVYAYAELGREDATTRPCRS